MTLKELKEKYGIIHKEWLERKSCWVVKFLDKGKNRKEVKVSGEYKAVVDGVQQTFTVQAETSPVKIEQLAYKQLHKNEN